MIMTNKNKVFYIFNTFLKLLWLTKIFCQLDDNNHNSDKLKK